MQVFLEHIEANFKNLHRMEVTSYLTLQFLSLVNNDVFFSLQVLAVRLSMSEQLSRLIRSGCLFFLEKSRCLTYNDHLFDKGNIHFEAGAINTDGNTWGEYFLKIKINTEKRWLSVTKEVNIQKKSTLKEIKYIYDICEQHGDDIATYSF